MLFWTFYIDFRVGVHAAGHVNLRRILNIQH